MSPSLRFALSVSAAVVGVAAFLHSSGAAAQDQMDVRRDVAYGGEPGQVLDAYVPGGGSDDRPVVLLVHGGGWGGGDKADYELLARRFVDEQGWTALAVNYRLDVPDRWPSQVEDVQAATRWAAQNAADIKASPERIGLLGGSSGGHLAAMVGVLGTGGLDAGPDDGAAEVRAVATWSAPLDLRDLQSFEGEPPEDCTRDEECRGLVVPGVVEAFVGCPPEECPEEYTEASPVDRVTGESSPMVMVNARNELIDDAQARDMAEALDSAGVDNEVVVLEGSGHALMLTEPAWEPTVAFLSDHLTDDDSWPFSPGWAAVIGIGVVALAAVVVLGVRRRS